MSLLRKLLAVAILGAVVYCFWPRQSSLQKYNAREIADLQVTAWQQARIKNWLGHTSTMFQIYTGQYNLPPITALTAAMDQTRAVQMFKSGATDEDKEKAADPLIPVYSAFKDKAGATKVDLNVAPTTEIQLWQAFGDHPSDDVALRNQALLLAQLYGGDGAKYQSSSRLFVQARKQGIAADWAAARTTLTSAYTELQKNINAPAAKK